MIKWRISLCSMNDEYRGNLYTDNRSLNDKDTVNENNKFYEIAYDFHLKIGTIKFIIVNLIGAKVSWTWIFARMYSIIIINKL